MRKITFPDDRIPRKWYNILADIKLNPPLKPDGTPVGPEDLAPVFPMNLIEQEVSTERWIDIPAGAGDVCCLSGVPARSCGLQAWKKPWARRPGSISRTNS